jgi:hypothetical protein
MGGDKKNVLWEKHRMYLPEMRRLAVHRCGDCLFFVNIQGRKETRKGCIVNIRAYNSLRERVPETVQAAEVIKKVGMEGLEYSLEFSSPEAQSCGKFKLKKDKVE